VRIVTARGAAQALVEITDEMQSGHVSLPNGQGLDIHRADGTLERRGVAVNELTDVKDRDPIAGTPWHKHVPVRIERLEQQRAAA
jgi:anaerobic selenocysteine-containing dehydrogenase